MKEKEYKRLANLLKQWRDEAEAKTENDNNDFAKGYHKGYRDALDMAAAMLESINVLEEAAASLFNK